MTIAHEAFTRGLGLAPEQRVIAPVGRDLHRRARSVGPSVRRSVRNVYRPFPLADEPEEGKKAAIAALTGFVARC
jgi:hypothetical protein